MSQSRLLVVDASVMNAAGDRDDPHSGFCSEVLKDIMQICHRVAITPDILKEWDDHQSHWAGNWRKSMVAKKKLVPVATDAQKQSLQTQVDQNVPVTHTARKKALEKDLHLLAATAVADGVLITCDSTLEQQCATYNVKSRVQWMILAQDQDSPEHRSRCLHRLKDLAKTRPKPPLPKAP